MSDAIRVLHDYLAKSPSVVYPQDVLEYLPAIKAENDRLVIKLNTEHIVRLNVEAENAKLRELVGTLRGYLAGDTGPCDCCAMQGTCENHPAPPPCKYELDGEHAPVLGWIDDNLSELGVEP